MPQGSILGPLLFLLFINDLPNCTNKLKFILFADDTNILYSTDDYSSLSISLNNELQKVSKWFNANKLTLNTDKSNYILFHTVKQKQKYNSLENMILKINNTLIERVYCTKFLGVYIDHDISWKTHICYVRKKISQNIGVIGKLRHILPKYILITLYNTLVLPFLSYCNVVWANTYPSKLESLFLLQKRFVRIASSSSYLAHTKLLFNKLFILNIYKLNNYFNVILLFKHRLGSLPNNLCNMLTLNCLVHTYNTRNRMNYHLSTVTKQYELYSFRHKAPSVWNSLPSDITSVKSLNLFKRKLKMYLISIDLAVQH